MRRAIVVAGVVVGLAVAGGLAAYLLTNRSTSSSPTGTARTGNVAPAVMSPVFLRVINAHGTPVTVERFAGDTPRTVNTDETVEITGVQVPPPWHVVIRDPASHTVLYNKTLVAGSLADLIVQPSGVRPNYPDRGNDPDEAGR